MTISHITRSKFCEITRAWCDEHGITGILSRAVQDSMGYGFHFGKAHGGKSVIFQTELKYLKQMTGFREHISDYAICSPVAQLDGNLIAFIVTIDKSLI